MSEDELDKIKKSFVRAKDGCSLEVACLLTVMKYYGGTEEVQKLTEWCTVDGKLSLGGMKQAAIRAGMQADLRLLDIELLARMKLPIILLPKTISAESVMPYVTECTESDSLCGNRTSDPCNIGPRS